MLGLVEHPPPLAEKRVHIVRTYVLTKGKKPGKKKTGVKPKAKKKKGVFFICPFFFARFFAFARFFCPKAVFVPVFVPVFLGHEIRKPKKKPGVFLICPVFFARFSP